MAKPDTAKKAVTPAEEAPPPQPKKSKKKLILLLALVVLLAAAGGGAYFFLMGEAPAKGESPAHAERHIMTLDPFLVNLADKDSRRYLKVKLDLEVPNEKAAKELEKSLPRLRDATILLLSSKSYADISTSEGKLQLKQQLLQQMTGLPGGKKIHGVFFTEFVAQ